VELQIDGVGAHCFAVAAFPEVDEPFVIRAAAFGAWSMAGSERGRLVKEKELGVRVRPHDDAVSSTELDHARDPAAQRRVADEPPRIIVQDPPVSHHEAAPREGDDFAERRDAVL
jgi:hypothetical protein